MGVTADYVYSRGYRGKVKALILDWSGTTADAYVLAPAVVFVDVFKKHGVEVSMAEARGPMGLRKDLHIQAMTEVPEIRERWKGVHGKYPDQGDVDKMFADFVPMQLECLREYTTLLPGVAEVTQKLQKLFTKKRSMKLMPVGNIMHSWQSWITVLQMNLKITTYFLKRVGYYPRGVLRLMEQVICGLTVTVGSNKTNTLNVQKDTYHE